MMKWKLVWNHENEEMDSLVGEEKAESPIDDQMDEMVETEVP